MRITYFVLKNAYTAFIIEKQTDTTSPIVFKVCVPRIRYSAAHNALYTASY